MRRKTIGEDMIQKLKLSCLALVLLLFAACSSCETKEDFVFGPTPGDGVTENSESKN